MTLKEQLVKIILADFLAYLDALENDQIVEKELDNTSDSSIYEDEE